MKTTLLAVVTLAATLVASGFALAQDTKMDTPKA